MAGLLSFLARSPPEAVWCRLRPDWHQIGTGMAPAKRPESGGRTPDRRPPPPASTREVPIPSRTTPPAALNPGRRPATARAGPTDSSRWRAGAALLGVTGAARLCDFSRDRSESRGRPARAGRVSGGPDVRTSSRSRIADATVWGSVRGARCLAGRACGIGAPTERSRRLPLAGGRPGGREPGAEQQIPRPSTRRCPSRALRTMRVPRNGTRAATRGSAQEPWSRCSRSTRRRASSGCPAAPCNGESPWAGCGSTETVASSASHHWSSSATSDGTRSPLRRPRQAEQSTAMSSLGASGSGTDGAWREGS